MPASAIARWPPSRLIVDIDDPERIFAAGVGYRRSGARYLVGHGRPWNAVASTAPIVGPSGIAAFYRKAALDFIGGLSHQLGMQTADVDLALMLNRAGFSATFGRRSRILAGPDVEPRESARFDKALYSERLFWRNLVGGGRAKALAAHAGVVALEMLPSLPRPRVFTQVAARLGACQFGATSAITGHSSNFNRDRCGRKQRPAIGCASTPRHPGIARRNREIAGHTPVKRPRGRQFTLRLALLPRRRFCGFLFRQIVLAGEEQFTSGAEQPRSSSPVASVWKRASNWASSAGPRANARSSPGCNPRATGTRGPE